MSIAVGQNAINWNIVHKNLSPGSSVRERLARKIAGVGKYLSHFWPETLYLQVILEKQAKKGTYTVRLTLRLPSDILHVEKSDDDLLHAIDSATAALGSEVRSLDAELRGDYRWKRPVRRARLSAEEAVVFAEPMEAGTGPQSAADMVADLLAAHDEHLLAHAQRGVRMAELSEELPAGAVDARDIVDEAAQICLGHPENKPDALTHEQWFYRLIREELVRQCRQFAEERQFRTEPAGERQLSLEDEAEGYDAENPLDLITQEIEPEEDLPEERIADPAVVPPYAAIAGQELVESLQREVKHWSANEQEIFELHYLVGFEAGDIAMICHQRQEEIEALIAQIQVRLRDFLRRASAG
jgi:DNA-directed RNA polymerase specialized sigma24 family protein/ribosome-associated translation inhibitor RaiA